MTIADAPIQQYLLLDDADWDFYERLLEQLDQRHVFVTYDRGRLELMSPSMEHDRSAEYLGLIIRIMAEELNVPILGAGSTTFKRTDLERGLEPDKCFYLTNEKRMRSRRKVDLRVDPPPDLVVEVEISRRLVGRRAIYAALGVPELWVYDRRKLRIEKLQEGQYEPTQRSRFFPTIPLDGVPRLIEQGFESEDTRWTKIVRRWVRQHAKK